MDDKVYKIRSMFVVLLYHEWRKINEQYETEIVNEGMDIEGEHYINFRILGDKIKEVDHVED